MSDFRASGDHSFTGGDFLHEDLGIRHAKTLRGTKVNTKASLGATGSSAAQASNFLLDPGIRKLAKASKKTQKHLRKTAWKNLEGIGSATGGAARAKTGLAASAATGGFASLKLGRTTMGATAWAGRGGNGSGDMDAGGAIGRKTKGLARRTGGRITGRAAAWARRLATRVVAKLAAMVSGLVVSAVGPLGAIAVAALVLAMLLMSLIPSWAASACQARVSADTAAGGAVAAGSVPEKYRAAVNRAGGICSDITPDLIAAQIEAESGWNPSASSPAGARGIAQFMPATWAGAGKDGDGDGRADITNPLDQIYSQGHYMCHAAAEAKMLISSGRMNTSSVTDLALAIYNAGGGNVRAAGGIPPFKETKAYIARINQAKSKYRANAGGPPPAPAPTISALPAGQQGPPAGGGTPATGAWNGKFGAPITGALRVSSPFGYRIHPVLGSRILHQGVDLVSPQGQPQLATAPGTITHAGPHSTCGNAVKIMHGSHDGVTWSTTHCHLSVVTTRVGAHVNTGDQIGLTGATGRVTGPHVHYQIEENGRPVDPMPFLQGAVAHPTGVVGSADGGGDESMMCELFGHNNGPGEGGQSQSRAPQECALPDPTQRQRGGACITPRVKTFLDRLGESGTPGAMKYRQATVGPPGAYLPMYCWDPHPANPNSDHAKGRACDINFSRINTFPNAEEKAQGDATARWMLDNANDLGIKYVIWQGRIWMGSTGTWKPYTSKIYNVSTAGGGHYDHIHVSFY